MISTPSKLAYWIALALMALGTANLVTMAIRLAM
jgi:hypothetical protein